jgi:hypothetical protein
MLDTKPVFAASNEQELMYEATSAAADMQVFFLFLLLLLLNSINVIDFFS